MVRHRLRKAAYKSNSHLLRKDHAPFRVVNASGCAAHIRRGHKSQYRCKSGSITFA